MDNKKCGKCGQIKSLGEFAISKKKNGGYQHWCKPCANEYNRERNQRLYTESFVRAKNLKQHYGITSEEYQVLFVAQNGVCAACGRPETGLDYRTGKAKNLHVDHCHKTERVRALLCKECNNALGLLHDDPERIRLLLKYAELHQSSNSEHEEGAE